VPLAGAVALLVLLNAIVAVLVVDLACLLDAEDVVGFATATNLAFAVSSPGFLSGWNFLLSVR